MSGHLAKTGHRTRRGGSLRAALLPWLLGTLLCGLTTAESLAAISSVEPITWNVVGLDSNRPTSGPNRFPVGARVCSTTAETDFPVSLVWESANPYIDLIGGSPNPVRIDIPAGGCADAYFEVAVQQTSAAFNTARRYHIEAGGRTTPRPRELYVKPLVSQARNGILDLRYGPTLGSLTSVPAGGSFSLVKGQTYFIRMVSYTAPGGYEQLETFSTLPNTIFQVLSVNTTYTADSTTNVSSPHDRLYGDACYWENDPASPNYLSCLASGKIGGIMTVTYEVRIIDVGSGINPIYSLIYDLSGASYHYNSDYLSGGRTALLVDPAAVTIAKRFAPETIAASGTATLTFTLSNAANGGPVSDVSFSDLFPAIPDPGDPAILYPMVVANPPNLSNGCGGQVTAADGNEIGPGASGVQLSGGGIGAFGSCSIKLDVTAPAPGTYLNTSSTVQVGETVTASYAEASLTVLDDYYPAPRPPSSCPGLEQPLASWTMPTTGQGSGGPPPPYSAKAADVATAVARYSTTTNNIIDPSGNPANSWSGTGWLASGATITAATAPWFEFEIDTSNYGGVTIEFDIYLAGGWGNANANYLYVFSSTDGVSYSPTNHQGTGFKKGEWTNFLAAAAATGETRTFFRIMAKGSASGQPPVVRLDNIHVRGCPVIDLAPPTISKVFAQNPVAVGAPSTLTFTLANPNAGYALTGVAVSDSFPPGLSVAAPLTTANSCGGTLLDQSGATLAAGAAGISLAGGTLPAAGGCSFSVAVTPSGAGTYANTSDDVTARESGTNPDPASGRARATLTALLPPAIAKNFAPAVITTTAFGGVSTLTFTLDNPNPAHALSGIAFGDSFPAGLVVATPATFATSGCGTPTFSPVAGAGSIAFSNGSLAAGGSCTVSVNVSAASAGTYDNTSGPVTHLLNGAPWGTDTASSTLVVAEPVPAIMLLKQVAASALGPWSSYLAVREGDPVYYRFTIENTGDVALAAVQLSDPALLAAGIDPAACTWYDGDGDLRGAAPLLLPAADASDDDHYITCVTTPLAATAGAHPNTATARGSFGLVTVEGQATAVYATAALTLVKSADRSHFFPPTSDDPPVSDVIGYAFTVTNSGFATLSGPVTINDDRTTDEACPPLASIGNFNNLFEPGEVLVCAASYTITAADVTAKAVTNTATATAGVTAGSGGTTSNDASLTLPLAPELSALKSNSLSGPVASENSFDWILTVANAAAAGDAQFSDGQRILVDELPLSGALYGDLAFAWGDTQGAIACAIDADTQTLTCTAAGDVTLPAGKEFSVTVPVTIATLGTLYNPRRLSADPETFGLCMADPDDLLPERDPGDNHCSNVVLVGMPQLTVLKSADRAQVNSGEIITYTLTVGNSGSYSASNVLIDDPLSPFITLLLDYDGSTPPFEPFEFTPGDSGLTPAAPVFYDADGPYTPDFSAAEDGNVVRWQLPLSGSFKAGSQFTLRFRARVK